MRLIFSNHALEQIKERNLSRDKVKEIVRKPDKIIQQSYVRFRAIRLLRRRKKSYLMIVVYDEKNSTKEIITAFITSKIRKYL
mgnify:FL=1